MIRSVIRPAILPVGTRLLAATLFLSGNPAEAGQKIKPPHPAKVLLEARTVASSIQEPIERFTSLERILIAQISTDPSEARETLKLFPGLPNRPAHFASLASVYAQAGKIDETERMYAEIRMEDRSSRQAKLAAADARGYTAVAHANAGKMEEAMRILARLREHYRENPHAIIGAATASIAEAQMKQGDSAGALETAKTVAKENPYALMKIVGNRVRSGDLRAALQIVSELDNGLQRYAQWGIVQAQKDLGQLVEAQLTASAIKPGHAKARALLELANYHLNAGAKSMARGLLQEAASAAASAVNNVARADVLWHIAAGMAEAGDTFKALETAKSIEKPGHRKSAIQDIVEAQAAQGDIKGAFNTALLLKPETNDPEESSGYEYAVGEVLAALVKQGRPNEARDAVGHFQDLKSSYPFFYGRIAAAQAESGDIKGAKASLALAETEPQRLSRKRELLRLSQILPVHMSENDLSLFKKLKAMDEDVQRPIEAIAKAQARKGDLHGAVTTAGGLTQPSHRLALLEEIGAIQVQTGNIHQALTWAGKLPSPADKAHALLGIAQALETQRTK